MLTHVFHLHLDAPWMLPWLRHTLPAKYHRVEVDQQQLLCFWFSNPEHDTLRWTSGRIVELLERGAPTVTAQLLYEICRCYDDRQDTSQALLEAVRKQLGVKSSIALFTWEERGATTTVNLKGRRRKSPDVVLVQHPDEDNTYKVLLPPSAWLCDVLLRHLKEKVQ